jgi:hypothetical protein
MPVMSAVVVTSASADVGSCSSRGQHHDDMVGTDIRGVMLIIKLPILWTKAGITPVTMILHGKEYHGCGKCVEFVDIANITWGAIHVKSELYESDACKIGITC